MLGQISKILNEKFKKHKNYESKWDYNNWVIFNNENYNYETILAIIYSF